MDADLRIRSALVSLGVTDVLDWARSNCTKPLVELNEELNAGVAPVDLQNFMAAVARNTGRNSEFVRTEAVRRLNEFFPNGFGAAQDQQFALVTGWVMWASLFEPSHRKAAEEVWDRLAQVMRTHLQWRPEGPDDPLLLSAFEGRSFEPSEQHKRLEEAMAFMEQTAARKNRRGSYPKAVDNFAHVPAGYGFLYGLLALDGQVCNGGFRQFFENTNGVMAALAAAGFRAIERQDYAALVEESIRYAATEPPGLLAASFAPDLSRDPPPRSFEALDEQYFGLRRAEEVYWLDLAMERLVMSRPDLF